MMANLSMILWLLNIIGSLQSLNFYSNFDTSSVLETKAAIIKRAVDSTPNCNAQVSVKFPIYENSVLNCQKYYECEPNLWWWELHEKTCPAGTLFSEIDLECLMNVSPTTCEKTSDKVVLFPTCAASTYVNFPFYENGLFSCQKYYACEPNLWWWELREKTCPDGSLFSEVDQVCVVNILPTCEKTSNKVVLPPSCEANARVNFPLYENGYINCQKYYECEPVQWWWEPHEKTCPTGSLFSETDLTCVVNISPITCEKTSDKVVLPPTCESKTNVVFPFYENGFPTCQKYYECEPVLWWWELHEKTCPDNSLFSDQDLMCLVNISPITCEKTSEGVVTLPSCEAKTYVSFPFYENGIFDCQKYYECEPVLWWWEPHLKTCPDKSLFSEADLECLMNISPTTCKKTSNKVLLPPTCEAKTYVSFPFYENGVQNCQKYYQCEPVLWWWEPHVKTCIDGFLFSETDLVCSSSYLCGDISTTSTTALVVSTTTTTESTTTSSTSTTTEAPIIVNCDSQTYQRFPYYENGVQDCQKYYECEPNLWWWEPHIQTCPYGSGFSKTKLECLMNISPTTCVQASNEDVLPPTCAEQRNVKFPFYEEGVITCKNYYECVNVLWYWELRQETCPEGTGFSVTDLNCASSISPETCKDLNTTTTETSHGSTITTTPTTSSTTKPTITTESTTISTTEGATISSTGPTTTIEPPIIVNCDSQTYQRFPYYENNVQDCQKYYECEPNLWWWEPHVQTCPYGSGFSKTKLECLMNISPTTCAQASSEDVLPPTCAEQRNVKFPFYEEGVITCKNYYECVNVLWYWELRQETCPEGTGFSVTDLTCASNISPETCKDSSTTTKGYTTSITTTKSNPTTTTAVISSEPTTNTTEASTTTAEPITTTVESSTTTTTTTELTTTTEIREISII